VIASIAHNLTRWTAVIGLRGHTIRAARAAPPAAPDPRPPDPHHPPVGASPSRALRRLRVDIAWLRDLRFGNLSRKQAAIGMAGNTRFGLEGGRSVQQ
jgi:hypothetical protein